MAMTLALRFPERFAAVGTHSGTAPAWRVQRGQTVQLCGSAKRTLALRLRPAGRQLPPLLVLHGDRFYRRFR
jgi:poly(3-hydroxybutyrate) depolymerase